VCESGLGYSSVVCRSGQGVSPCSVCRSVQGVSLCSVVCRSGRGVSLRCVVLCCVDWFNSSQDYDSTFSLASEIGVSYGLRFSPPEGSLLT
jgi:hypothetical protein